MEKTNEEKTVMEWCISCRFTKTEDGKYYVARGGYIPTSSECLQCLYESVKDIKVTKPSNWKGR